MSLFRDVIASQGDDVWLETIGRLNSALDLFAVGKWAVMNVRKLDNTESIEGFGQSIEQNSLVLDREHVRLAERRARDVRQAQGQGTQRCIRPLGAAKGRDTSTLVPSDRSRHLVCLGLWRRLTCPRGIVLVGRIIETCLVGCNLNTEIDFQ